MYMLFNFCDGNVIYTRERSSRGNTIHCITYLALTQLFPVLVTSRFHIMKYTHYVAFCCISFKSLDFLFSHECVHMGQMDFISSIFVRLLFFFQIYLGIISLIRRYRCVVWSVPTVCAFYPESQTVETLRSACILMCCLLAFWDKHFNFWQSYNVHAQPGQCFLQSPLFCIQQKGALTRYRN